MKNIDSSVITKAVKELVIKANKVLPSDLVDCISCSEKCECSETAKSVLSDLKANIDAAAELDIPICQDTGMAVIFAEIGRQVGSALVPPLQVLRGRPNQGYDLYR